jgi:hypothetical protein
MDYPTLSEPAVMNSHHISRQTIRRNSQDLLINVTYVAVTHPGAEHTHARKASFLVGQYKYRLIHTLCYTTTKQPSFCV